MIKIPETLQDLLTDEKKAFVYLATHMNDGTSQVTPVWVNTDTYNDTITLTIAAK